MIYGRTVNNDNDNNNNNNSNNNNNNNNNNNSHIDDIIINPKHQYAYSPYCSLYISKEADKENLFHNQELL